MLEPITIAYYVSSHGFGHLTRTLPLLDHLQTLGIEAENRLPPVLIYLCSAHPKFLLPPSYQLKQTGVADRRYTVVHRQLLNGTTFDGVCQLDGLRVDLSATLDRLCSSRAQSAQEQWLRGEVEWLKRERVRLVICDAPFVACQAAHQARIPAVIHSNFMWDAVYECLIEELLSVNNPIATVASEEDQRETVVRQREKLQELAEKCREIYRDCWGWLRMPGWVTASQPAGSSNLTESRKPVRIGSKDDFRSLLLLEQLSQQQHRWVYDVPALMRRPSREWRRETVLAAIYHQQTAAFEQARVDLDRLLNFPNLLLVTFGGHPPIDQQRLLAATGGSQLTPRPQDWLILIISPQQQQYSIDLLHAASPIVYVDGSKLEHGHSSLSSDYLSASDGQQSAPSLPDLIKASSVVLSKLGYGTCGECIASQSRMLYVPRRGFGVEERALAKWMNESGSAAVAMEMPLDDFLDGRWAEWIARIMLSAADKSDSDHPPVAVDKSIETVGMIFDKLISAV